MNNDLPPRKTLVMLFQSLQYAQSDGERREIVQAARVIRRHLQSTIHSLGEERSPLARQILAKCSGQTLSVKVIARICGKSHEGTPIKRAIRELIASQQIERVGKGLYRIAQSISSGQSISPVAKA